MPCYSQTRFVAIYFTLCYLLPCYFAILLHNNLRSLRRPLTGLVPAIRLLLRPRHPVFFSGIFGVSEASIGLKILFTISQSYFRLWFRAFSGFVAEPCFSFLFQFWMFLLQFRTELVMLYTLITLCISVWIWLRTSCSDSDPSVTIENIRPHLILGSRMFYCFFASTSWSLYEWLTGKHFYKAFLR